MELKHDFTYNTCTETIILYSYHIYYNYFPHPIHIWPPETESFRTNNIRAMSLSVDRKNVVWVIRTRRRADRVIRICILCHMSGGNTTRCSIIIYTIGTKYYNIITERICTRRRIIKILYFWWCERMLEKFDRGKDGPTIYFETCGVKLL